MLNIAQREGWIRQNPFAAGESLISLADERKRERILTREEERKLLDACAGHHHRKHLRPILICAVDTGMRRGEILSLRWHDVDFVNGLITIRAFNTKTMKERQVSLTARLASELETLWQESPKDQRQRVFGIVSNVKRSFTAVRKAAGLPDVRFHDLRHTHATRLVALHLPLAEVGRLLGRGASAFGTFPSLVLDIVADSTDRDRITLSMPKCKGRKLEGFNLQLDKETRWFGLTDQPVVKALNSYDLVMAVFPGPGTALRRAFIEEQLKSKVAVSTITNCLKRAIELGKVTQPRRGEYMLAGELLSLPTTIENCQT